MHAKSLRILLALAASIGILGSPELLWAKSYKGKIYPLDQVKRGQKGYGLTTMKGSTPEKWKFEVIGVNRNFLPKMDIILVKSDDPKIVVSGFWQGMSGSPLFLDGKLLCAFSYGFRFNKLAIGGCTPLHYMKEEGLRPRRGDPEVKTRKVAGKIAPTNARSLAKWLNFSKDGNLSKSLNNINPFGDSWMLRDTMKRSQPLVDAERGMQAAAVPLALSGFSAYAFDAAKSLLKGFPLVPMQAGGTGSSNSGPTEFEMGGPIAVQLVRGDMSAAASGTVSYIQGDQVLAFGHPMFHTGEIYAPVSAAEVHTVIPSALNAFWITSPLRELGALTQDRQSTIAADTSLKVGMIPMHIEVKEAGGKKLGDFDVEILRNRFFTAGLASVAAGNAASLYVPDRTHVTLKMKSRVEITGHKALEFTDYYHSGRGAESIMGAARGLRVLSPLLNNDFSPARIESISLDVEIAYKKDGVDIVGLSFPGKKLIPGKRNYVQVQLKPVEGEKYEIRLPFDVPKRTAGSIVRVEVAPGDTAPLYVAPPTNLKELIEAFRTLLPGTVYAVTVYSGQEAAAIDGRLVKDLPPSAINRLRTSSSSPRFSTRNLQARTISPAKKVVEGSASLYLKVADK